MFSRRYHPFPLTGLRLEMDRVIVPGLVARRIALSGMRYDDELAVKTLGAGFTGRRCRLSFVLEGSARLHVGQTAADLRPGQFFFSPDAQQQWTQTDHLEVVELDWEPEGLASPMGSLPAHGTLGPSALARLKQVVESLTLTRRQAPLAFAAQFTEVIEVMASIGASVNRDFRLGEAPQPNEWLFEKVDEVLEGLDKNPQSVDLELRTGLPRQKLSRLVKDLHQQFALTGTSDSSWRSVRNFYRLLMASIILGHPEAHPARVSRLVGFGSLEAMDHAYANAGMPTPEQLRRRIRGLPRQTISNGLER